MTPPYTIFRLAATGNVHQIFSGGRVIPEGYDGVLYQRDSPIGLLGAGSYNAAVVLQSLLDYDGSSSTLFEICSGIFEIDFTIKGLPDPGNPKGLLLAHVQIHMRISDPIEFINYIRRKGAEFRSDELAKTLAEEFQMLLDPIVACERRENLFSPSLFHETAGLTMADYFNTSYSGRGIILERVTSLEFDVEEVKTPTPPPPPLPSARGTGRLAAIDEPSSRSLNPAASQPEAAYPAKPPKPATPSSLGSWGQNIGSTPELADDLNDDQQPYNPGGWQADAAPSAPPMPDIPRPVAANVVMLRGELAKALVSDDFHTRFARASNFQERFRILREIDFERLLSDEKIGELAQKLTPGQFDFRWTRTFFVDQQSIFNLDQMREFQMKLAEAESAHEASKSPKAAAIVRQEAPGNITRDGSSRAYNTPAGIYKEASESDELPPPRALKNSPNDRNPMGVDAQMFGGMGDAQSINRQIFGTSQPQRPGLRMSASPSEISQGVQFEKTNQNTPDSITGDPDSLGNIDLTLAVIQSVKERNIAAWSVIIQNNTPFSFNTLKISARSESLVSAGAAVLSDVPQGGQNSIELRLALTRQPRPGEIRFTIVGFTDDSSAYAYQHRGRISFRPSSFGNEHLVTIEESPGSSLVGPQEALKVSTDIAATTGGVTGQNSQMRRLTLQPDDEMTRRIRTRLPSADRGLCSFCGNETLRRDTRCNVCGAQLPRWFAKEPLVLTASMSASRARVERARLWVDGFSQNSLWIVMGGTMSLGRRHDNDIVLRAFDSSGRVDERRTTELSRLSGQVAYSQGVVRFQCRNRHGVRFNGRLFACDQEFELQQDGRLEFLNRQGEVVLGLGVRVLYPGQNDALGSVVGAQGLSIIPENDPRLRNCLMLFGSCSFSIGETNGIRHFVVPAYSDQAPGRLIQNDDTLWIEPLQPMRIRNDRTGDTFGINTAQLLRVDEDCRMDLGMCQLMAKVFHTRVTDNS